MRTSILTAVLAVGGLAAAGGEAQAQFWPRPAPYTSGPTSSGYGWWDGGYPPYATPYSYYPPHPEPNAVQFVRSLYHQYLNREPDPQGMRTWLRRFVQYRGDTDRLTREFLQAAQFELNTNNPAAWPHVIDRSQYWWPR